MRARRRRRREKRREEVRKAKKVQEKLSQLWVTIARASIFFVKLSAVNCTVRESHTHKHKHIHAYIDT